MEGSGNNFIYPSGSNAVPKQWTYSRFREQLYCSSTTADAVINSLNSAITVTAETFRRDKMNIKNRLLLSLRVCAALASSLVAASVDQALAQNMTFQEYEPNSTTVVPEHHIPSFFFKLTATPNIYTLSLPAPDRRPPGRDGPRR